MLKNCELLKEFKREQLKRGKRKAGEFKVKAELNLERRPLVMNVASARTLMSSVILQDVVVAGVPVKALIDFGATTSYVVVDVGTEGIT